MMGYRKIPEFHFWQSTQRGRRLCFLFWNWACSVWLDCAARGLSIGRMPGKRHPGHFKGGSENTEKLYRVLGFYAPAIRRPAWSASKCGTLNFLSSYHSILLSTDSFGFSRVGQSMFKCNWYPPYLTIRSLCWQSPAVWPVFYTQW